MKRFLTPLSLIVGHIIIFTLIFFLIRTEQGKSVIPTDQELLTWDAGWYFNLKNNSYTYIEDQQSNVAFFPLFPAIWKYLDIGILHISIFNFLIYTISVFLLLTVFDFSKKMILFSLSIPSFLILNHYFFSLA